MSVKPFGAPTTITHRCISNQVMQWAIPSETPQGFTFLFFTQVSEFNFKCSILSACLNSYICIEICSKEDGRSSNLNLTEAARDELLLVY
jgi:hypothetical protein